MCDFVIHINELAFIEWTTPFKNKTMKKTLTIILAVILITSYNAISQTTTTVTSADSVTKSNLPKYDHIVIVVEENKDYSEIMDEKLAPYINKILSAEGANFTNMYGEEHFSQGNYFWLFSGDNQNVGRPVCNRQRNVKSPFDDL